LSLVPGILAFLVTLIGGMLTALNIVSEKEVGTIEQINVSPIKKYNFILGKLIPFWILAMIAFTLGLIVSRFVYGSYFFLVTLIGGMLTALNIVSEKEVGTIEQINVSPIKKYNFILGKLIPFWILAMIAFTMGLLVSRFVYHIEIQGNLFLLYFFIAIYLFAILGFGLLISTYSETQQQAMFTLFFFIMIFLMCKIRDKI
jgi:ABC-type transport system involved in multi-copper enzyme maturation permease subunit